MRRTVQPVWLLATEMLQVLASVTRCRCRCRFRCYHRDRCHCRCYWVSGLVSLSVLEWALAWLRDPHRRRVEELPRELALASELESNQRRRSLQLSRPAV